jgi:hypothetical protein
MARNDRMRPSLKTRPLDPSHLPYLDGLTQQPEAAPPPNGARMIVVGSGVSEAVVEKTNAATPCCVGSSAAKLPSMCHASILKRHHRR